MRRTQYGATLFEKNKATWTKVTIGSKVNKPMLENALVAFGGTLVKETSMAKYYEVPGDRVKLLVLF